ncbi:hypothetical protein COCCADRAFT_35767 [Bipolaris zeicola 26-R-13]|uniref:F-box domain-containing protein n=1 Tax=Cochliobolus carbonum (strain 26-R-13) TaxID=930089 RepID=W6YGG4_COCC2|nr:uncharacterized protein COCCADRAFT_35767 [Bipolaris zeicola 26-R-13]EUC34614.1 hypothetical protein COCCADRAFT_35767 [Bipolaris zeicola 26-R-13]
MGFFRRSLSFGSSRSRPPTDDSASDTASSRTSIDSAFDNEISESLATITKLPQKAPILTLPVELIQQVSTYLDTGSAASFCLSSRFVYYALGTNVLSAHVEGSKNRFEKRRIIEAVVERAFPGHWFCGWCDKFHLWNANDGPKTPARGRRRDCADFNSYLYSGSDYVLRYHHVRLAINSSLFGPEHGIPLSSFTHEQRGMAKISRTPVPTKLQISAKISGGRFLLHSSFAIILPSFAKRNRNFLSTVWPLLPHILSGHHDSENGHTGLMAAVDNVVRRGWKYQFTQNCSMCATDWAVSAQEFPHATGGQMRLVVQTWRDLGTARTPFETSWRAHGVCTAENWKNNGAAAATCLLRTASLQAGAIRRAFESEEANDEAGSSGSGSRVMQKSGSSGARIYRSFMRKNTVEEEEHDDARAVRRSSARPRYWRTAEENAEAARRYDEERRDAVTSAAEDMARMTAQRARTLV